ncbi:hypothetical protein GQX74_014936 [Glossina fuscipes]|nr:hypothetical protein GQX74_014936 [Glossina fuscipes]
MKSQRETSMEKENTTTTTKPTPQQDAATAAYLLGSQKRTKEGAKPPGETCVGTPQRRGEARKEDCGKKKRLNGAARRHLQALIKGGITVMKAHKHATVTSATSENAKLQISVKRDKLAWKWRNGKWKKLTRIGIVPLMVASLKQETRRDHTFECVQFKE